MLNDPDFQEFGERRNRSTPVDRQMLIATKTATSLITMSKHASVYDDSSRPSRILRASRASRGMWSEEPPLSRYHAHMNHSSPIMPPPEPYQWPEPAVPSNEFAEAFNEIAEGELGARWNSYTYDALADEGTPPLPTHQIPRARMRLMNEIDLEDSEAEGGSQFRVERGGVGGMDVDGPFTLSAENRGSNPPQAPARIYPDLYTLPPGGSVPMPMPGIANNTNGSSSNIGTSNTTLLNHRHSATRHLSIRRNFPRNRAAIELNASAHRRRLILAGLASSEAAVGTHPPPLERPEPPISPRFSSSRNATATYVLNSMFPPYSPAGAQAGAFATLMQQRRREQAVRQQELDAAQAEMEIAQAEMDDAAAAEEDDAPSASSTGGRRLRRGGVRAPEMRMMELLEPPSMQAAAAAIARSPSHIHAVPSVLPSAVAAQYYPSPSSFDNSVMARINASNANIALMNNGNGLDRPSSRPNGAALGLSDDMPDMMTPPPLSRIFTLTSAAVPQPPSNSSPSHTNTAAPALNDSPEILDDLFQHIVVVDTISAPSDPTVVQDQDQNPVDVHRHGSPPIIMAGVSMMADSRGTETGDYSDSIASDAVNVQTSLVE